MKIRTQLVLACFLLSIVPLGAIVLYTYHSSRTALQSAYRNEAARTTRQMDHRLAAIRNELEQRLADVSALPLQTLPGNKTPASQQHVVDNVLLALGDTANLVDSLELQPLVRPTPMSARVVIERPAPTPHPEAHATPKPDENDTSEDTATDADETADAPEAPEPPDVDEPETIVIDIPADPKMPRFSMSDEQRQRLRQLGDLGHKLGDRSISDADRTAIAKQVDTIQKAFNDEMTARQKVFNEELTTALRAREEARRLAMEQRARRVDQQPHSPRGPVASAPPAPRVAAVSPAAPAVRSEVTIKRKLTAPERAQLKEHEKRVALLIGEKLKIPVRDQGTVVANLTAQVKPEAVIKRILGNPGEDGELTFAADRDNNVYTRNDADLRTLDRLSVTAAIRAGRPLPHLENWIVAMSTDQRSGLRVGVARRVADDLQDLRRNAAFNFMAGIALVIIALLGIVPVANHVTRDVNLVTAGAERIALGDLQTRVPVRSKNEFGKLAAAFNKMAKDLSAHQLTILQQERSRKEQEMQQQMLEMEYDRKSVELEDARRFQLSMLPKFVPQHPGYEIAVSTETATEVGGDYYDFHAANDGVLSVTVGDATGHGAKAGTMVTVVKTLFASYTPALSPAEFLRDSAEKIKRMELGRMAMSLLLARFENHRLTIAAAGMPPALVHRAATGTIDELALAATPLGTLGTEYAERSIPLTAGDTILLLTDGFPELLNAEGQQLGYTGALEAFARAARAATAAGVVESIVATARAWRGEQAPNDDMTFVVVRVA
ncbi:MAG TPA: SpoIIE family protein phosphatase [Thermoanaerobaculia bacterium]|nr:SpoIIE family protein phosphatase [Thermoanaerobaculia bacterium]